MPSKVHSQVEGSKVDVGVLVVYQKVLSFPKRPALVASRVGKRLRRVFWVKTLLTNCTIGIECKAC